MPNISYFGCRVLQRVSQDVVPLFVFVARVREIKAWAGIKRVEEDATGTQRVHRPAHSTAIAKFLGADVRNTIPNSLLLAFAQGTATFAPLDLTECANGCDVENRCDDRLEWGTISFDFDPGAAEHERAALVVDGQHRVYGMAAFASEDLPVLAVALLDSSADDQAFQFIVINNKATKVPTDNVKAIIANFDEEQLKERLLGAGVRHGQWSPFLMHLDTAPESPFQSILAWPNNDEKNRIVTVTAIEQMLRFLKTAFTELADDDDSSLEIFTALWSSVSDRYQALWKVSKPFMSKVNLTAMNEFIIGRLKTLWEFSMLDIFERVDLVAKVGEVLDKLPSEYWTESWKVKIQDNATLRKLIKDDLQTMTDNHRYAKPWNDGLKAIEDS